MNTFIAVSVLLSVHSALCLAVPQKGQEPWIFMHYHKSGHDLANDLADVFTDKKCDSGPIRAYRAVRNDLQTKVKNIKSAPISVVVASPVEDWQMFGPSKIVHFVRDPADMIVSGYLYHSQDPPPSSEAAWLHSVHLDTCTPGPNLSRYIQVIQEYVGETHDVHRAVENVKELCDQLTAQYEAPTIYKTMKLADQNYQNMYEGLRVEAVRALVAKTMGDLMPMVANAIWESRAPVGTSHRVFMSDLPVGERVEANTTITALMDYLMPDPTGALKGAFWKVCITKQQATYSSFLRMYIDPLEVRNETSTHSTPHAATHITKGFVSSFLREHFKHKLLTDPHIGPLLRILQFVLLDTTTPAVTGARAAGDRKQISQHAL